jgi:hypothetical protein
LVTADDTLWPTTEIWCLIYLTNFISSSHPATSNCRRIGKWGWRWALWIHDQKPQVQLSVTSCETHSRTDTGSGFLRLLMPPSPHYSWLQHSTHVPPSHSPEHWAHSHIPCLQVQGFVPERHLAGHGVTNCVLSRENPPTSFVTSVRPSARKTAAPTKMIFVKFYIGGFYEKLSRNKKFGSNRTKYWEINKKTYYERLYCQEQYETFCSSITLQMETILKFPRQQWTVLYCWQLRLCQKQYKENVSLHFHGKNGYANAPQCYLVRTFNFNLCQSQANKSNL